MSDDGHDLRAIACVPVNPNDYPPLMRTMWHAGRVNSGKTPQKYEGSVESTCYRCGIRIWVGPRQQTQVAEWRRLGLTHFVLCMVCPALFAAEEAPADEPIEFKVQGLGNPQFDK